MSIELRFSEVNPPAPDPPKTIYRDVLDLPDPVELGITIRYFNHDDVQLYFQITASAAGYTFGTVNLGALASGTSAYRNLDDFGSRAKPSAGLFTAGEFDETVQLTLKAYTDAGYTNLKWTHDRTVGIHWIKSDDPAWTLDFLNNFDDGTVQGWAVANETGNYAGYPQINVVTDYVLSALYSCRMVQRSSGSAQEMRARLYKSFTTPDRAKVFAVINLRNAVTNAYLDLKNVQVQKDATILVFLGRPYENTGNTPVGAYVPLNKWMRIVVPLPRNVAVEVRLVQDFHACFLDAFLSYFWLDDFKIISK